jgi:hypothetical protein
VFLAIESAGSISLGPQPRSGEFDSEASDDSERGFDYADLGDSPRKLSVDYEEEEILASDERKEKPYSFKRTVNCWANFIRSHSKLRDNRKLKHNINQTFFRGLKDIIKHLEIGELYDFSVKFVGVASKSRAYRTAFEAFVHGVQPHVGEVYQHFCKKLRYNHANISFCQKERMRALEVLPALKAFLQYTAFVFYDLDSKRLEEKFKVTYIGSEPLDLVWLRVKAYYSFNMLIEEVCLSEAEVLRVMREEKLIESFVDAHRLYKS